jgi:hypothetical protein
MENFLKELESAVGTNAEAAPWNSEMSSDEMGMYSSEEDVEYGTLLSHHLMLAVEVIEDSQESEYLNALFCFDCVRHQVFLVKSGNKNGRRICCTNVTSML